MVYGSFFGRTVFAIFLVVSLPFEARSEEPTPSPQQLEFFEAKVRPLLVAHCYECHSQGAERVEGSLLLDSRDAHLTGGDTGEAIVPGDPDNSLLIEAIRYEGYEMPPKGQLSEEEINVFVKWVEMGAPWPQEVEPANPGTIERFDLLKRKQEHWAWQPINNPPLPKTRDAKWPATGLDRFILAGLERQDLRPAERADELTILRRVYMDLIGLPPTIEQIRAFEEDDSGHAIENVVEQLLESPHFGERWGRHWLDLMRYAESRGHEFDNDTPNAFQYRDYVIRALNADIPYDQLVLEHIAGDLIESPRMHPKRGFNESILGTGFWHLGEWVHSPVDTLKDESDRFDNMIDVMSKAFLGVTVSCARCHDHKFDAISTADYYSLTGYLHSSDYRQVRFETLEHNRKVAEQLWETDRRYRAKLKQALRQLEIDPPPTAQPIEHPNILVDFGNLPSHEFIQDGFIFGDRPYRAGELYLDASGQLQVATEDAAVSDAFWEGLSSVTLGGEHNQSKLVPLNKSGRTLRSPTFRLEHGDVVVCVEGKGHIVACVDSHRMVAGPLHKETIQETSGDRWTKLDLRRYVGHRIHLEFIPAAKSQLSVRYIAEGLDAEGLADIEQRMAENSRRYELFSQQIALAKSSMAATALAPASISSQVTSVSKRSTPASTPSEVNPLLQEIVRAWQEKRDRLRTQIKIESQLAPAMLDGTGEDAHIYIRGNSSKPGKFEPRHFLTAICGDHPMKIEHGSGRLELAEAINQSTNPLTSRVIVNRIWHHLMGRGIVPTTDDFGVLGMRPTHPALLDHLATKFDKQGRSIKAMIRYVVLSQTYQMSSKSTPSAREVDPKNLLWHHRPPKRLEGEAIRDSLLAISGALDREQYGPSVPVHLTSFMDGRGRPKSGPLDGAGRRSIYVAVRRNFLSPFMLTFDTPVPFSTMGRRNVSNVPAQSLILMNDPFVVEQAAGWARHAIEVAEDPTERISWLYETAFTRKPTTGELKLVTKFVGDVNDPAHWSEFAHALINTKEFIFLR